MNTFIQRIAYILCTLLPLACFSPSSHAEWVEVASSDIAKFYVDSNTMRRDGNLVKFWQLTDYKVVQKDSNNNWYLSIKIQYQLDCKQEVSRLLFVVPHAGHMGQGNSLKSHTYNNSNWIPASPGSVGEGINNDVCKATQ